MHRLFNVAALNLDMCQQRRFTTDKMLLLSSQPPSGSLHHRIFNDTMRFPATQELKMSKCLKAFIEDEKDVRLASSEGLRKQQEIETSRTADTEERNVGNIHSP